MAVIIKYRHRVPRPHVKFFESTGQTVDSFIQSSIGIAGLVAVDDFTIRRIDKRRFEQFFNHQRILIALSRLVYFLRHR